MGVAVIDTIWDLLLLVVVGGFMACLVLFIGSFAVTQVIKARYASQAALREQEYEHEQAKQVDLP